MKYLCTAILTLSSLVLTVGPALAGEGEATLTAATGAGTAGDTVEIPIVLDGSAIEPTGTSAGIAHDGEVLTLTEISMGSAVETLFDDEGEGFWVVNIDPAGGPGGFFAFAAIISGSVIPLPSEDDLELAVYHYEISEDAEADSSTDLLFTEELAANDEAPLVAIEVVNGIEQTKLTLKDGALDVVEGSVNILGDLPGAVFLRGDANGNGVVDGLSDGLFLLRYGFQEGKAPPCDDAADADDNGELSALGDGLRVLRWAFTEGPEPPSPGTSSCGTDPGADDGLGCATESSACLD